MVCVNELSLTLNKKPILHSIHCTLTPAHITAFIGKSGAGKTMLMRCIAQLMTDYQGEVVCNDVNLRHCSHRQRACLIGMVLQQWHLFPHMTVEQNCINPQRVVHGRSQKKAKKRAVEILEKLGLSAHLSSYPCQLSGGQQQRVAIARVLCIEPKVILFDEPSSALDPATTASLVELLRSLQKEGLTIGFSSHDVPFIQPLLDRAYLLEEGRIIEYAEKDQLANSLHLCRFLQGSRS